MARPKEHKTEEQKTECNAIRDRLHAHESKHGAKSKKDRHLELMRGSAQPIGLATYKEILVDTTCSVSMSSYHSIRDALDILYPATSVLSLPPVTFSGFSLAGSTAIQRTTWHYFHKTRVPAIRPTYVEEVWKYHLLAFRPLNGRLVAQTISYSQQDKVDDETIEMTIHGTDERLFIYGVQTSSSKGEVSLRNPGDRMFHEVNLLGEKSSLGFPGVAIFKDWMKSMVLTSCLLVSEEWLLNLWIETRPPLESGKVVSEPAFASFLQEQWTRGMHKHELIPLDPLRQFVVDPESTLAQETVSSAMQPRTKARQKSRQGRRATITKIQKRSKKR